MARIDPAVRRAVLAGLAAGQTMTSLADQYGISANTVMNWKKQARDLNGTGTAAEGLLDSVLESVAVLETPALRGTAALAVTIARRIVDAEQAAETAQELLDASLEYEDETGLGESVRRQVTALRDKVESVKILADLSPKLLAALTALGGAVQRPTAAAGKPGAAPATGDSSAGDEPAKPPTALDKARARRAERGGTTT